MMIKAISRGINLILRKPFNILGALLASILFFILISILSGYIFEFIYQVFFLNSIPNVPLELLLPKLFFTYPFEMLSIGIMFVAMTLMGTFNSFNYSFLALANKEGKKVSAIEALKLTINKIGNVFTVTLFSWILMILFFTFLGIFSSLILDFEIIGIIILLIYLLISAIITIKLIFIVPIMVNEKIKLNKAIKKSWKFTDKRFWQIIILLIISYIIFGLINSLGLYIAEIIYMDTISEIIIILVNTFAIAILLSIIPTYYFETIK